MLKLSKLALIAIIAITAACSDDKKVETTPTETATKVAVAPVETPKAVDAVNPHAVATPDVAAAGVHGDGVAAAALNPKPRSYADKAWQASVDDSMIAKVIVEGGAAIGKSPMMTANPDLKDKPEVVKALVAKIRTYNK